VKGMEGYILNIIDRLEMYGRVLDGDGVET
jgi:hypothetical protein